MHFLSNTIMAKYFQHADRALGAAYRKRLLGKRRSNCANHTGVWRRGGSIVAQIVKGAVGL